MHVVRCNLNSIKYGLTAIFNKMEVRNVTLDCIASKLCVNFQISSVYQAAQYPSRKHFNVLLHGSGYELDLPEGPLLVVELKSVPRLHQTPAPSTALDHQTYSSQSSEFTLSYFLVIGRTQNGLLVLVNLRIVIVY